MPQRPTREGMRRLWARRWFRRITYVLASGAIGMGGLLWTVQRPFFNRWIIQKADALSREETGLAFQAQSVAFHPLEGRLVLEQFSWGGDLLQADRLEIRMDLASLFGAVPHIKDFELEKPRIIMDAKRLARIHLKPHSKSDQSPKVLLDHLAIRGGQATVQGGAWGLPDGEFTFRVYGQGTSPNQIQADVRVPRILLKNGASTLMGSLSALGDINLSGSTQEIKRGELRLGASSTQFQGRFEPESQRLAATLRSAVDLGEAIRFAAPSRAGALVGRAELKAEVAGSVQNPSWNLTLQGRDIASPNLGLRPGALQMAARGTFRKALLKELHWTSSQGEARGSGEWKKGVETRFQFRGGNISLDPAATWLRAAFLRSLKMDASGEMVLPGDPWNPVRMNAITLSSEGRLRGPDGVVGSYAMALTKGDASVDALSLTLPELSLNGTGRARLGPRGVLSASAEGKVDTDAAQVAAMLHEWDTPHFLLDMGGHTKAQAQVSWNPSEGLKLTGSADVDSPRWERAQVDHLKADVRIQGSDLWVDHIQLEKGEGRGSGNLWLTWRDLPPGGESIDMCYQASRLPIEEGMKASGLEPEFAESLGITGLGSGWVRIHGPYDRIRIEASALAEAATVKGIQIPLARGDMDLDLAGDRLSLRDLRVAETPEQLGSPDEAPSGDLALRGSLDMDLKRGTWQGGLKGRVDSQPLGFSGPRFQSQAELRLTGPWSAPTFPYVSGAALSFTGGRLFFSQMNDDGTDRIQSIEGLHGSVEAGSDGFRARVAMGEHTEPIVSLDCWPQGKALIGGLDVHIGPQTADTQHLASSLTQDLLVDGVLDLQAEGRWDEAGLSWKGRMENFLGRFDGFDVLQESPALLHGDASQANLDLNLLAQTTLGEGGQGAANTGTLHFSGHLPFSNQAPLSARLQGQAELSNLKVILDHVLEIDQYSLLGYLQPKGTAQFDLTTGGTYASPMLEGDLSMKGGRLLIQTYPQSVEDLEFKVHFQGRDILLAESEPLQGRLAQGQLQAWGQATWDFGGLTRYDLHAKLKDFQLRDLPEGFDLHGSLDANLRGDGEKGVLRGTIEADRMLYQAEMNLRDFILSSTLGGSSGLSPASPDDPLANIALDLDVKLKEWEFDTNLLKVQGRPRGPLKIQGNLLEPGLKGVLELVPGGRITNFLPAGDVILEEGSISFPDPTVFSPRLDLTGRIDISPFVVNLKINGPLDLLDMKTTSTPSLRQDEILAILIDPSQAATIGSSTGQNNQSAMSSGLYATTSGLLTTLALAEFQDRLRRLFNLDRVSVVWRAGTAGNSETNITLGKSADLFGLRTPLVYTHKKVGDVVTQSGQAEWRLGSFVFQLGVSQSGSDKAGVAGEIRHTWIPRW